MARLDVDELIADRRGRAAPPRRSPPPADRARRPTAPERRLGRADRARDWRRRPAAPDGRTRSDGTSGPSASAAGRRTGRASAFAPNRSRCAATSSSRSSRDRRLVRQASAAADSDSRGRRAAPRPLPRPRSAWRRRAPKLRQRRSVSSAGLAVAACRPIPPSAGRRTGCRRGRRPPRTAAPAATRGAGAAGRRTSSGMSDRVR